MDRVTYLILAGEKQPPWWYQLGRTKRFYGSSLSREHHWKEQQTQHNATKTNTRRSFHFSTDKPSTRDTILPKKIRKVTIQHQRRRGKNRQTLAKTNQKTEKAKRKHQPLILLFQRLRIFLYKWEPNAEDNPTYPVQSRPIYGTTKPCCNLFLSWRPTSGSPSGLLGTLQLSPSSPSQSEKCVCGCEIEKIKHERFRLGRVVTLVILMSPFLRQRGRYVHICVCIYIYIYIYTYVKSK